MARNKIKTKRRRTHRSPKKLKNFLLSEEGKIKKRDLAKLGLSLAILAGTFGETPANAQGTSHSNDATGSHASSELPHSSAFSNPMFFQYDGHVSSIPHVNGLGHANHVSHNSHGQW